MNDEVRERVDAALRTFVTGATDQLRAIGDDLAPPADALRDFVLDGGKRLRPAFCYFGALAAGATDSDALVRAAASLELLQACALVHDDVIDHSDTRRGQPAVHKRFETLHSAAGWSGSAADFGTASAVLLGDLLLAWSDSMLSTSGIDDAALRRCRPVFDAMRLEVMAGQYLDIVEQARGETTVDRALRIARLKSAKYTIERPLHLGAEIAGASPEVLTGLSAYGIPLGEAFQLRDDLLGVFGDPDVTGKPVGDDLREGKQTVLVALTLERASDAEAALLRESLGNADLSDEQVATLCALISDSGAEAEVQAMIRSRWDEALSGLETMPLEKNELQRTGFDALVGLASVATRRRD